MTDEEMGQGEIRRGFERLEKQLDAMQKDVSARYHDLSNKMTVALGPISELRYRMDESRKDLDGLGSKIAETGRELSARCKEIEQKHASIEIRAALASGAVMAVVFILKFMLGK